MRRLIACVFLLASLPAIAEDEMQICWVRRIALLPSGEAAITIDKLARGYELFLEPSFNGPPSILRLSVDDTGKNGGNMTVQLPIEKWAIVRTTHDRCEFRWDRQGEVRGIKVIAINTYFMHGGKPSVATAFLPFDRQQSPN